MNDEQTITIDGTAYKSSELSDEAKALVESLQFTAAELNRAKALVAVMTTAHAGYMADLKRHLPAMPEDTTKN